MVYKKQTIFFQFKKHKSSNFSVGKARSKMLFLLYKNKHKKKKSHKVLYLYENASGKIGVWRLGLVFPLTLTQTPPKLIFWKRKLYFWKRKMKKLKKKIEKKKRSL